MTYFLLLINSRNEFFFFDFDAVCSLFFRKIQLFCSGFSSS